MSGVSVAATAADKKSKRRNEPVVLPDPLPPTLRPKQAAALLGIAESTFWAWQRERPDFRNQVRKRHLCARVVVLDTAEVISFRDSGLTLNAGQ